MSCSASGASVASTPSTSSLASKWKCSSIRRSISARVMAMARSTFGICDRDDRNEILSQVKTSSRRTASLEVDQLGAFAHLLAGDDAKRLHGAGARRADRVLHLHRLEDEQRRALLDRGTRRGDERDHLARHRRDEARTLLIVLGAADAEQVDERERVGAAVEEDVSLLTSRDNRGRQTTIAERRCERAVARGTRARRRRRTVERELPDSAGQRRDVDLAHGLAVAKAE